MLLENSKYRYSHCGRIPHLHGALLPFSHVPWQYQDTRPLAWEYLFWYRQSIDNRVRETSTASSAGECLWLLSRLPEINRIAIAGIGNCDIQQLLKIGLIVKAFFLQSVYCIYICRWNLSMHLIKAGVADIQRKRLWNRLGACHISFSYLLYSRNCILKNTVYYQILWALKCRWWMKIWPFGIENVWYWEGKDPLIYKEA